MKAIRRFYIRFFTRRAIVTDTKPGVLEEMIRESNKRAALMKAKGEYIDFKS